MTKPPPSIICFIGIDGSGKSTLAKWLSNWFNTNYDAKTKYVWNRPCSRIMMTISLAIRTFSLKGKAISEKKIEKANLKDLVLQRKPLSYIYKRLLVFDYAISNLLRLWPYFILRRGVICDRYAYDAIVGLAINQLNVVDASDLRTFVNMLHRIVPDPDVIFLIDVPPEVALQRKRDIPSLEFVRVRREVYKLLGKEYISMVVLNGAEPLSELQKKIIRFLELEKLVPSGGK